MQSFKINESLEAVCEWAETRQAFKHVATLLRDGAEVETVKICYLNRTWERYTYESVLQKLADKSASSLTPEEVAAFKLTIANGGEREAAGLHTIGAIAALGSIFHAGSVKESNDWKERMLKAGLEGRGLIMPDDWDELDEATKAARLDAAIASLTSHE